MKVLLPGKRFCEECAKNGRECQWCHRPLPERFYSKRIDVCDTCINRRERQRRANNQTGGNSVSAALDGAAETTSIDPQPGNTLDVLQFFTDNQTNIVHILEQRLETMKGIKWFMTLFVRFIKYNQNNETVQVEPIFRSLSFTCTN